MIAPDMTAAAANRKRNRTSGMVDHLGSGFVPRSVTQRGYGLNASADELFGIGRAHTALTRGA
ncbi:MAG: hypothetical protein ABJG86_08655 [Nitratireductor sp.]